MSLLKRQQVILDKYLLNGPVVCFYDDLPSSVRTALETVKNQETLWCDAERYISDKQAKNQIARRGTW